MVLLSPALSVCDSLADIDDLDAYLAGKGALSRFPTPPVLQPPKNALLFSPVHSTCASSQRMGHEKYHDIAEAFYQARYGSDHRTDMIYRLIGILSRAGLSLEAITMAYSILTSPVQQYHHDQTSYRTSKKQFLALLPLGRTRSTPTTVLIHHPLDALLIAALYLVLAFTNDSPPSTAWWARHVSAGAISTAQIKAVTMEILASRDWSLMPCFSPDALDTANLALSMLARDTNDAAFSWSHPPATVDTLSGLDRQRRLTQIYCPLPPVCGEGDASITSETASIELKLKIGAHEACWAYGQLTPDDSPQVSPDGSMFDVMLGFEQTDPCSREASWLPLL